MGSFLSQSYFIPAATITEHNCPSQKGRVFLITGGYAGLGLEVARMLVGADATVYIAGRSETKASAAIADIRSAAATKGRGRIEYIHLDLSDLASIRPAVEVFKTKESRLDVLINNAGVFIPPVGSKTAQSHDLQIGTNCLGPYLLNKLLSPLLMATAESSPTASVRVLWAGSLAGEALGPKNGGMQIDSEGRPDTKTVANDVIYAQSKVGNLFIAKHCARQSLETKIIHVAFNPGNLRTQLQRHWKGLDATMAHWFLLHPAINGARTVLWAALSAELGPSQSGAYVWPWGRLGSLRADIEASTKTISEGGTGMADEFVSWCDKETARFL